MEIRIGPWPFPDVSLEDDCEMILFITLVPDKGDIVLAFATSSMLISFCVLGGPAIQSTRCCGGCLCLPNKLLLLSRGCLNVKRAVPLSLQGQP